MRNLLVITDGYPDENNSYTGGIFVKEQIKYLKEYFKEIYTIAPMPLGVNIKLRRKLQNYKYNNVKVFFPRYFYIPINYFGKKRGDSFFKAALRVIERERLEFDLIHAHFTWASGYGGTKLKEIYNVPLVVTTHGLHITRVENLKKQNALRVWNSADAIINVSRKCVELLKDLRIPESKLRYIPNGVDINKFQLMDVFNVRKQLGIPDDRKVIVSVGNLVKKKGYIYLIKAAKKLQNIRRDFIIYIIGGGPLHNSLQDEIRKSKLREHVKLVGPKPHDEIPFWMNAADLFVLPSLVENFGVVNIEALACGKPVVSTYNGGSEEIIISDNYGFLCPPADPECLAEEILIALEKEWNPEKIREYAKQFTWENVAKQIVKVYETLWGKVYS